MSESLPKQKKLVLISEAAKFLGVSIDTVRRWDKSGILQSERLDGKNRYFFLNELEKYKTTKPLPISEVAKKLNISPTTLRRLEARGIFKPQRNSAGERVYGSELIKSFQNSDYFLRKKPVEEKVVKPLSTEKELDAGQFFENDARHYPQVASDSHSRPLKRIPEFLAAFVIFVLLFAIGITNIQGATAKSSNPAILGISKLMVYPTKSAPNSMSAPTPTPTPTPTLTPTPTPTPVVSNPEQISPISVKKESTLSANQGNPIKMLIVKINDESSSVEIRQKPSLDSKIIGIAGDGDTLNLVSEDLEWYGVRLPNGLTGFIAAKYIEKGETNN